MGSGRHFRILIYSHDTFGLGHLRRCRAIAHALVDHRSDVSCLILSGSPIIGAYGFMSRVDFVRFPGVVKLRNGSYSPRGLDISIEDAIAIRKKLIEASAEAFAPHIFLVDKEPYGLRREVESTLKLLKTRGTKLVLGLRDIMDDQDQLAEEWDRKHVMPGLEKLYDEIWVYGAENIYDPLAGLDVSRTIRQKMVYTGYLRRDFAAEGAEGGLRRPIDVMAAPVPDDFTLVTTGGGGDGAALVDWVLRACETGSSLRHPILIVTGPFMTADDQSDFQMRASRLANVELVTFLPDLDRVMQRARAIVAMGGYNTFCEILAADKPALIVPRTEPRLEQFIRASRMSNLGAISMLDDRGGRPAAAMAEALRRLQVQGPPSAVALDTGGFASIKRRVDALLSVPTRPVGVAYA